VAKIPKKLPRDVNSRAVAVARIAIGEDDENIDHRTLDSISAVRTRAAKGGTSRAQNLTTEQRRQIARKAAASRWRKR
jgi:hypothetical protein